MDNFKLVFPREIVDETSCRPDAAVTCLKSCNVLITDTIDLAAGKSNELIDGSGTITHRYEGSKADEAATLFIVKIISHSKTWKVYRRFREFNAIKTVFNLHTEEFRDAPKFPSKTIGKVTGKNLIKRKFALNTYINHFVKSGGYGIPNLVDILFAFLEIPVNLSSKAHPESFIDGDSCNYDLSSSEVLGSCSVDDDTRGHSCRRVRNDERHEMVSGIDSNSMKGKNFNVGHSYAQSSVIQGLESRKQNWEERSETTKDWHSVVSEVSTPDSLGGISISSSQRRLSEGIVVIKHGRKGTPKTRLIRVDSNMDRLYWLDVASAGTAANDLSRSVALNEVVNIRSGVKYIRNMKGGKECVPNFTKLLNNTLSIEELKTCLSIELPHRFLEIQCITRDDYSHLHSALLSLTNWCI